MEQFSAKQSGLSLSADKVVYAGAGGPGWELAVGSIAIIGEYTDASGPSLDDWFLVFVADSGERYTAPAYTAGLEGFLAQLERRFNAELRFGLCHSTELNSRIIWPPDICDEPLFRFVPIAASGLLGWLKNWIAPVAGMELASAARDYINNRALPTDGTS